MNYEKIDLMLHTDTNDLMNPEQATDEQINDKNFVISSFLYRLMLHINAGDKKFHNFYKSQRPYFKLWKR